MIQKGMSVLFEVNIWRFGKYLNNIYEDEELVNEATTKHFSVV